MAAAVCQGLRSWSDPGFHLTQDPIPCRSAGRSFLEAILMGDRRIKDDVYVHTPFVNPSTLRLSQKSLELCTENLGNETGSDMSDSESMEACALSMSMTMKEEQLLKPSQGEVTKAKKYAGFPPPLTTIKGKELLRFKPHREQGRLVLEAVKMLPANSIFQAERSRGRLTLCFLDKSTPISGHNVEEEQDCRNQENEEKVKGNDDDIVAADRRTTEKFKMSSRFKDGDHHRQLQHENRGLLNLGVIMGSLLLNFRSLFLVVKNDATTVDRWWKTKNKTEDITGCMQEIFSGRPKWSFLLHLLCN